MRRVSIDLQVEQQVIYPDSQQVERYDHKTQAVLLELESFTKLSYQTPQGSWPLSVHTQHLHWHFEPADQAGKIRYALTVDYQIKNDQELLGNYRFRLIYVA